MLILAFESSCDETAVALVRDGRQLVASALASQMEIHSLFGGVVPEIASRKHVEQIIGVLDECLQKSGLSKADIDAIAVTAGPGLVGALLVGVTAAKALASVWQKPLIAVNHIEGHIAANYLSYPDLEPPFTALVISGGHSHLLHVKSFTEFELLGRSRDDAAGEAFDKTARILGLGYPGGPKIQQAAEGGNPDAYKFSLPQISDNSLDFSFSGLKTQAVNFIHNKKQEAERDCCDWQELINIADYAASFQKALVDMVAAHVAEATELCRADKFVLAGGVAANSVLRERLAEQCAQNGVQFYCPPIALCTDNAEMIAAAAYFKYQETGRCADAKLNAKASLKIGELI